MTDTNWDLYNRNHVILSNMLTLNVLLINEIVGHDISSTINNEELCHETISRYARSIMHNKLLSNIQQ